MKRIKLTDRTGPSIGIFWVGEFGHLIMHTLPRINAMRKEYPEYRIVVASYEDDYIYFKNNKGEWTIDEYISFPWWPVDRGCHQIKGPLTVDAATALHTLDAECDVFHNTADISLREYSELFKSQTRISYAFKNIVTDDHIADGNHIIIYARAKNYHADARKRSWTTEKWKQFLNLVLKYNDLTAYVCGVAAESVHFDWSDRIVPVLSGPDRATNTLNLLSNAKYCISDCSGSANLAIQVGIPTFVSGPPDYIDGFMNTKNYFGTYVGYQPTEMSQLTPQERYRIFIQFLDGICYDLKREVHVYTED